MVKLKPARHQKTRRLVRLQRRPTRRPPSSFQKKLYTGIGAFFAVLFILILAVYIGYRAVLSYALNNTEPQLLLLAPREVEDTQDSLVVAYLAAEEKNSFIVTIAGTTQVTVPGGYGQYRLSAVYPLLELDHADAQRINASFSRIVGRVVDQTIGSSEIAASQDTLASSVLLHEVIGETLRTHHIPFALVKLWYLRRHQLPVTSTHSLAELHAFFMSTQPDLPGAQDCPVAVLNASSQAGAAQEMAALLGQAGALMIRTSSFPTQEPQTTIYTAGEKNCASIVALARKSFLHLPTIVEDQQLPNQYRASVVVVIGTDFQ